jgi:hypothetical protein
VVAIGGVFYTRSRWREYRSAGFSTHAQGGASTMSGQFLGAVDRHHRPFDLLMAGTGKDWTANEA